MAEVTIPKRRKPPKPRNRHQTRIKSRLGREHPMHHPNVSDLGYMDFLRYLAAKYELDEQTPFTTPRGPVRFYPIPTFEELADAGRSD